MNQKTSKLLRKLFGRLTDESVATYNSLSKLEKAKARERMKLLINTSDRESLFNGKTISSDVKLEV